MLTIEYKNIYSNTGHTPKFNNVSFTIQKGHIHLITGESNSGKSTLIRMLFNRKNYQTGKILIDGKPLGKNSPDDLGIYWQDTDSLLFQELSVLDNFYQKNIKKTQTLLNLFNITDINLFDYIKVLDKATQIKLNLLRFLTFDNLKVLFIDDFSILKTFISKSFIEQYITHLLTMSVTVVITDYELPEFLRDYIDIIFDIKNGEVIPYSRDSFDKYFLQKAAEIPKGYFKNRSSELKVLPEQIIYDKNKITGVACNNKYFHAQLYQNILSGSKDDSVISVDMNSLDLLFPNLSIFENIIISTKRIKKSSFLSSIFEFTYLKKERQKIERFIQNLNIAAEDSYTKVSSLGLGDKKKVILARFIFSKYDTLVFTNIFDSVDNSTKTEIINLISELSMRKKRIIIVSDNVEYLKFMCHNIFVPKIKPPVE